MARGRVWRLNEDQLLTQYMNGAAGKDPEEAFKDIAVVLNRTERACSDRWRILSRKKRGNVSYIPSVRTVDPLAQIRSHIDELEAENEALKRRVTELEVTETKYNNLCEALKTVTNRNKEAM